MCWRVGMRVMKHLTVDPSSCYFFLLDPNIPLSILFSSPQSLMWETKFRTHNNNR
jgi:hypothetical protein